MNDPISTGQVQVSADGKTIWVHAFDGSTVGRFSMRGMDVHTTVQEQMQGASQCLHCTHTRPELSDWLMFCEYMRTIYNIHVDPDLMSF